MNRVISSYSDIKGISDEMRELKRYQNSYTLQVNLIYKKNKEVSKKILKEIKALNLILRQFNFLGSNTLKISLNKHSFVLFKHFVVNLKFSILTLTVTKDVIIDEETIKLILKKTQHLILGKNPFNFKIFLKKLQMNIF